MDISSRRAPETYAAAILAGCGIALVWACLIYAGRGLDLTDEGYYLNAMRDPQLYGVLTTQAGVVYHALFVLTGGDIWALRAINITLLYGLSCAVIWQSLSGAAGPLVSWPVRAGLVFGGGASVFYSVQFWLLTPSYNWLTLQALLATALAVQVYLRTSGPRQMLAALAIGVCTGLCVLAKPTSGLLLAVLIFGLMGLRRQLNLRCFTLAAIGAVATGLLGLIAISGDLTAGVAQLRFAVENTQIMGGGYSLAEMVTLSRPRHLRSLSETAVLFGGLIAVTFWNRWAFATLLCLLALVSVAAVFALIPLHAAPGPTTGLLLSLALIGQAVRSFKRQSLRQQVDRFSLPLFLAIFPFTYAFGSNNPTWVLASSAAFFWLVALLRLLRETPDLARLGLAAVALGLTLSGLRLDAVMHAPYRQDSDIRTMNAPVRALPGLRVSTERASYLNALTQQATDAGLSPQTPMIDMTGRSPGALFVLQAMPLGAPWVIGAYPGSDLMATRTLGRHDCALLAAAWLLYEPDGPRKLSDTVLTTLGLPLPALYTRITKIQTSPNAPPDRYRQDLLRPTDPIAAQKTCETLRAQQDISR